MLTLFSEPIMIELAGSVGADTVAFSEQEIAAVLKHPQQLQHSDIFTGRPATKLFATQSAVAKIRTDFVFQPKDALRRAKKALQAEQTIGCYHPLKTWFITEIDGEQRIGNIMPRLTPFHAGWGKLLEENKDDALARIKKLLQHYFKVVAQQDKRLDEGLSNFAWDNQGNVYYLDDDHYHWDDFTSFANVLLVWIRQTPAFDTDFADPFGAVIVETLFDSFNSAHTLQVLYGQLRNNLAVGAREERCIEKIIQCISTATQSNRQKQKAELTASDRDFSAQNNSQSIFEGLAFSARAGSEKKSDQQSITEFTDTTIGVIADVHANLPALDATLSALRDHQIKQILVLGDVVGYGPHPEACIQRLREESAIVVQGNHDYAASSGDTQKGFSRLAAWAIDWTIKRLGNNEKDWLAGLPPVFYQDDWMAVHGSPIDKYYFYAYVYHMTYQDNLDWLVENNIHAAFHGHSHIQMSYLRGKGEDVDDKSPQQKIADYKAALVCPGSVGQPRAGATGAEYAIFNRQNGVINFHRVDYDVEAVIADMHQFQFPESLCGRLRIGK